MEKYKISEVAKIVGINRTALIHYDKWGIIKPSIRNEKNYRFYTPDDINKLELVIALKESGLSLEAIKSYLNNQGSMTSIEILTQQKEEIDNKIKALNKQGHIIEKRIEHLKRFDNISIYEGIRLDEYPEMSIYYEPIVIGYGPLMSYNAAVNKLKNRLEEHGQLTSKYGICYDITNQDNSGHYSKKFVFDYLSSHHAIDNTTQLPKSRYLRTIHKGPQNTVDRTIEKVTKYATDNHYQITGEAYYVPLFDYWESVSDEFIAEILIPIDK